MHRVLGYLPQFPAALADSDFRLAEQAAHTDPTNDLVVDMERRVSAGRAFLTANFKLSIRRALLARTRPMRREFTVCEWVPYWRVGIADSCKLDMFHWKGPAVAVEPPRDPQQSPLDRCYWLTHGTALLRCTHEQVRPEAAEERVAREGGPTTSILTSLSELRKRLASVRGLVQYVDLSGRARPDVLCEQPPAADQPEPPLAAREREARARAAQEMNDTQAEMRAPPPDSDRESEPASPLARPAPSAPDHAEPAPAALDITAPARGSAASSSDGPSVPHIAAEAPPRQGTKRWAADEVITQVQEARRVCGEQLLSRPCVTWTSSPSAATDVPVPGSGEDLECDTFYCLGDDCFLVRGGSNKICLRRLSNTDRARFDEAKDHALCKYIRRGAWLAQRRSPADVGKQCPLLFVLTWKTR